MDYHWSAKAMNIATLAGVVELLICIVVVIFMAIAWHFTKSGLVATAFVMSIIELMSKVGIIYCGMCLSRDGEAYPEE